MRFTNSQKLQVQTEAYYLLHCVFKALCEGGQKDRIDALLQ